MSISKKLRFEVFKRDGFICQYCGKTPPDVTLEIDHINPKSKKGTNNINNLVTACFDCNRGKRNITLDKVPNTIKQNIETLKEKELQLKEYNKMVAKIERRIQKDIDEVEEAFKEFFPELSINEQFRNVSIKKFLKRLPKQQLKDIMGYACSKMIYKHSYRDERDQAENALSYFCGICWHRIRERTEND